MNNTNKKIAYTIGLVAVLAVLFSLSARDKSASNPRAIINGRTILLEIADTPASRTQGLSDRESLPRDTGMLFVFGAPNRYSFWMKNMHFPLDLIWIRESRVVDLTVNAEPEGEFPTKNYTPKEPVTHVLEVNAGIVEEYNIEVGDTVELP